MKRLEVVPWSIAPMREAPISWRVMGCSSVGRGGGFGLLLLALAARRQERPDQELVRAGPDQAADQRTDDRHPPVIFGRREGLRSHPGQMGRQARTEVAGRVSRAQASR